MAAPRLRWIGVFVSVLCLEPRSCLCPSTLAFDASFVHGTLPGQTLFLFVKAVFNPRLFSDFTFLCAVLLSGAVKYKKLPCFSARLKSVLDFIKKNFMCGSSPCGTLFSGKRSDLLQLNTAVLCCAAGWGACSQGAKSYGRQPRRRHGWGVIWRLPPTIGRHLHAENCQCAAAGVSGT